MKKGLILINLGTPEAPSPKKVRKYLKEFLMDPFVIDIPLLLRWLLVNIILWRRPRQSAAAYKKIWSSRGSPLFFHTVDLAAKVQSLLENDFVVLPAMRYGQPSLEKALEKLKQADVQHIYAFPLYPQYSLAATESSIQESKRQAVKLGLSSLEFLPPFYAHEGFIEAFAEVGRPWLEEKKPDHVLFSFHGIPERHVKKTDATGLHCLGTAHCCEVISESNKNCYRAQCFATAHHLAQRLGLHPENYTVSFQSRLGKTPWIKPYTDLLYRELAQKNKKRVLVFCPSFVADCLETLEEIALRGRQDFKAVGGEELWLVPSLNSENSWAQAVAGYLMLATQRL